MSHDEILAIADHPNDLILRLAELTILWSRGRTI